MTTLLTRFFATMFAISLLAAPAVAQVHKIDLGAGAIAKRAALGERVRVNVDFAIPAAELPRNAKMLMARRELVRSSRESLLGRVFADRMQNAQNNSALLAREATGPRLMRKLDNIPSMAMELTLSEMNELAADPMVERIYEDQLFRPMLDESTVQVGAPVVWTAGSEGAGVAVAILDSGTSHDHTMTSGRVTGSACFSTTSGTTSTTFCPGGTNSETGGTTGTNCPVDDPATNGVTEGISGCSHGTHVGSTAMGGVMNLSGGNTINGVARGADLVAIQVFSQFNNDSDCDGNAPCILSYGSDQRAGLDFVLTNAVSLNIASANMSLGGGPEQTNTSACDVANAATKTLIDLLRVQGVATVIASGNESFTSGVTAPGCISTAVTVGSVTKQDVISGFSNSSDQIDLLAPGSAITAAYPNVGGLSYANSSSGTSMATPHVAGAFALLRSAHPSATVDQIEDSLKSTGTVINDARNGIAKPRIRVDLASAQLTSGGTGLGEVELTPVSGFFGTGSMDDLPGFTTKTYTLTNTGTSEASFSVSGDKNWLGFDKTSGTIAANDGTETIVVSVETDNVSAGQSDTGTITFSVGSDSTTRSASLLVKSALLNDDFADAFPLSGITVSTSGDSTGATFETGESDHNPTNLDAGGSSVWFRWKAPLDVDFTVSTAGSTFDTTMSIYTGDSVTNLTFVAGNDDENFPSIATSKADFTASSGTTYYIAIDGFNGAAGNYDLSISPQTGPGSDNFANAVAIADNNGGSSTFNVGATAETGEPAHAGQMAANSVWFDWTAPSTGEFLFATDGSAFDTVLGVYTGTAVGSLTEVTSNDDGLFAPTSKPAIDGNSSLVTFDATSGQSYKIAVDGKNGETGFVQLSWFPTGSTPLLLTSVLPNARSVQVGQVATGFLTAINAGTGTGNNCGITLPNTDFEGGFSYQTTDSSNALIGTADTPIDIGEGNTQSYVFAVTPSAEYSEEELTPVTVCTNGLSSDVVTGVNTFLLSADFIQPADMLTIASTPSNNGVIEMESASDNGFVVVATSAIGAGGDLTFSANDGGAGLPFVYSVCETDPGTSACLASPASSVDITSANGEQRTFAAFVTATGDIPFDPAGSRLFLVFKDALSISRGGSSVALRTDFVAPSTGASTLAALE